MSPFEIGMASFGVMVVLVYLGLWVPFALFIAGTTYLFLKTLMMTAVMKRTAATWPRTWTRMIHLTMD